GQAVWGCRRAGGAGGRGGPGPCLPAAGACPPPPSRPTTMVPSSTPPAMATKADPDRLAELEDERAFLLRSLDDLDKEHDAGDIDDAAYATLRDGYTARAATVLRAIESQHAALPPKARRNCTRIAVWGAALVVVAILAGVLVAWASGDRLPGDSSSGDIAESVTSKLAEARSLQATDLKGAVQRYDEVLKVEPDNA